MYKIEYRKMIYRRDVQNNPNGIFIFGDNDERIGYGGQAKEMRGEMNAVGVRVKKAPSMDSNAFYTDNEYEENIRKINHDLDRITKLHNTDKTIVFPSNGIGTGMAKLDAMAPITFRYLTLSLKQRFGINNGGSVQYRSLHLKPKPRPAIKRK